MNQWMNFFVVSVKKNFESRHFSFLFYAKKKLNPVTEWEHLILLLFMNVAHRHHGCSWQNISWSQGRVLFYTHSIFVLLTKCFQKPAKKLYFTTRRFNQLKMLSAQPDYSSVQLIFQQLLWFSVQGWNYPTKISSSRVRDWVQLATPCSIEKVGIESENKKIIRLKFHLNWNSVPARKLRLRSSLLIYKYFIPN